MKVLMLNGSWNANGSSKSGLEIMAKTFADEGVETEIFDLGAKPVRDCIACGKCAEKKACVFTDDAVNEVGIVLPLVGLLVATAVVHGDPDVQDRVTARRLTKLGVTRKIARNNNSVDAHCVPASLFGSMEAPSMPTPVPLRPPQGQRSCDALPHH